MPLENDAGHWIIGNPENRRVRNFQQAAATVGMVCPACVSWRTILDDPDSTIERLDGAECIRIESPGENNAVLQRLINRGGGRNRLAFGEIGFLKHQYLGFSETLNGLSTINAAFMNSPGDIQVMFDKWKSHQRFKQVGIARPETRIAPQSVSDFREFRSSFGDDRCGRVFLKPRYASSASGVCAYRWSGDKEQLIAPIRIQRNGAEIRLYNSLRVHHYTSSDNIHAILSKLLPQDMIAERWIRKAQLADGQFDLRVVVIGGEARHIVVRQSHQPMTNLHLGNRRGDLMEVWASLGDDFVEECRHLAQDAAACFPESLYAGVDVIAPAKGKPMICEINAFGDLLPGVRHRGESTYEAIVRASNEWNRRLEGRQHATCPQPV